MLKKITLIISHRTRKTDINEVRVWAWMDGVFAIHKGIGWETDDKQSPNHWVLTHVPTSGACKTSLNKQDVIDAMFHMKGWKFAGKPFEEAKACDIIEFATLIPAMNGKIYNAKSAKNYTKNIKPFFEKAIGCN